ncbi:MAG TPA: ATP-dependent DNA helicase RecQ [Polyangiaceae bacterium]|nr:ATP-dependent DNA helicase RecQ [Polyangiaceae bacterium]
MSQSAPSLTPAPPRPMVERAELVAREAFGVPRLHPWQAEAVGALLGPAGRVLVVAPTGGGKSLCYQLPALLLGGTAIILSPLISLMEDQVRSLSSRGIAATFLASTLSAEERARRVAGVRRGDYRLVYAAPERLVDSTYSLVPPGRLSLLAVDEAHCVVQWGHDFRPDYLRIGALIERFRPPRVLACTATATPASRAAILQALSLDGPDTRVILRGFARPNLALDVTEVTGPKEARRQAERAVAEAIGEAGRPRGAAIVYAPTRKQTEQVAEHFVARGFRARPYHAGLDGDERGRCSEAFQAREVDLVVATNAFGMGIDRPDVRLVVHTSPPSSIEAYYQEVGRGGRDGAPARGLLCFAPSDIALRKRLIEAGADGSPADAATQARLWGLFRDLLRFVDAQSCRHDFILRYFGDESESLGGCGRCDVCRDAQRAEADPASLERDTETVRMALAGVARARRRGGLSSIAEMLAGVRSDRVERFGFHELSTFGLLRERGHAGAMAVLRAAIAAGYLDVTTGDFPVPFLTRRGADVMRGTAPSALRLKPPPSGLRPSRSRASSAKASAPPAEPLAGEAARRYERLRTLRGNLARERKAPPYVIASELALRSLAQHPPRDLQALEALPGWGPLSAAKYGLIFLKALAEGAENPYIGD